MANKPTLKEILPQLRAWCAVNNVSVQSVYDTCHGMTLQELVYYLFGVVKDAVEDVVNYENDFKELYDYVHNYFDNLDVQNEINSKLDEMLSDGSLAQLLYDIMPLANVKNYGAVGDGVTDDTQAFKNAIADNNYSGILIPQGQYKITETLYVTKNIDVVGNKNSVILFYPNADNYDCFVCVGNVEEKNSIENATVENTFIQCSNAGNYAIGDMVLISATDKIAESARDYDTKQQISKIVSIDGNTIELADALLFDYTTGNNSSVQKINSISVNFSGVNIKCENYENYSKGIHLNYCENVQITNCHGELFDYSVITLEHCYNFSITKCSGFVLENKETQYLITVEWSYNGNVANCYGNSMRTAIDVSKVSGNITVSNNNVTGNINTHASINIIISNNTISNGIIMIRGTKTTVSNNIVNCINQSCILFDETALEIGDIFLLNNMFSGMVETYIPKKIVIENNTITRSSGAGLKCNITSVEWTIIKNNCFYNFDSCIDFSGCNSINNVIILDNLFSNIVTALKLTSLATAGLNCQIKNNTFYATNPIVIRGINHVIIEGNFFSEKASNSIMWSSGAIDSSNIYLMNNINLSTTYFFVQESNNQVISNVFENNNVSSSSLSRYLKASFTGIYHTVYTDTTNGNVYEVCMTNGEISSSIHNSVGV